MSTLHIIFEKAHTDRKTGFIIDEVTFKDCTYVKQSWGIEVRFFAVPTVYIFPWHQIARLREGESARVV